MALPYRPVVPDLPPSNWRSCTTAQYRRIRAAWVRSGEADYFLEEVGTFVDGLPEPYRPLYFARLAHLHARHPDGPAGALAFQAFYDILPTLGRAVVDGLLAHSRRRLCPTAPGQSSTASVSEPTSLSDESVGTANADRSDLVRVVPNSCLGPTCEREPPTLAGPAMARDSEHRYAT